MYQNSYDDLHRTVSLNLKENTKKLIQKGLRDSFICEDCEKAFSYDDDYASQLFTENRANSQIRSALKTEKTIHNLIGQVTEVSHWSNFDFKRLQNFIFSVLIRGHLAEIKQHSSLLDEDDYLRIKFFYLNVIISDDSHHRILIINLDKSIMHPPVLLPYKNYLGDESVYTFAGGGFLFHVLKPGQKLDAMDGLRVRKNGNAWIIHVAFEESGILRASMPSVEEIKKKDIRKTMGFH